MKSSVPGDPLTGRQRQVLTILQDHWLRRDPMPTLRELCQLMGTKSTNGMNDHILALAKKGYLELPGAKARSFRLTPLGLEGVSQQVVPDMASLQWVSRQLSVIMASCPDQATRLELEKLSRELCPKRDVP